MQTYWITTATGHSERFASELSDDVLAGRTADLTAGQMMEALREIGAGLEFDGERVHVVDVRGVPAALWQPETEQLIACARSS